MSKQNQKETSKQIILEVINEIDNDLKTILQDLNKLKNTNKDPVVPDSNFIGQ